MRYTGESLKEISFPLGGIGTGSVGLAGNGSFIDWEIFGRPCKGSINGYTHFAVRAIKSDKTITRVLNSDLEKDLGGQYMSVRERNPFAGFGFGADNHRMCGFPHFKNAEFNGEFPMAEIRFKDGDFPAKIKMRAFSPFIPRDAFNSSIPAAFFGFELENTESESITYQFAFSLTNPYDVSHNESFASDGISGITMKNADASADEVAYGDLTVATDSETAYTQSCWYRGEWQDNIVTYWNEFSCDRKLHERTYDTDGKHDTGTLVAELTLLPGEKGAVRFVLSWNIPNDVNYWTGDSDKLTKEQNEAIHKPWKKYYATVFADSVHSARYSLENYDSLFSRTLRFTRALHDSTLPSEVIDAAASNLSVLRSPTCLRLEDGSFYGWEGVSEHYGSCEGTCQHVWNYAYAMCFLFPELERSIRELEFKYSTDENGRMGFRLMLPIGTRMSDNRACLDGEMGAVIKCYREWLISGDDDWLHGNWENIKLVLEYAWSDKNPDAWDNDRDGVLEGRCHHTLDMELFGPSSWLQGMYLAALKAASIMASYLGDDVKAKEYSTLFDMGYAWTRDNLFNGKYFIQKIDLENKSIIDRFEAGHYWNDEKKQIKYQIGEGSSIDQLLGQWHADILGLGDIFDREQIATALESMMKNNFKRSMREHTNPWRIFALNDEAGSVICDYPEGTSKPKIPVPYCEEAMTGFEYSFAGLLVSRCRIDDGLRVTKAVRDRFNGSARNPYNEFECGSNYARSMASYALLPLLCGFEFDMPHGHIGFRPYKSGDFTCVWSLADAWGNVEFASDSVKINIFEGAIALSSVGLENAERVRAVKLDGKNVDFTKSSECITFDKTRITDSIEIAL